MNIISLISCNAFWKTSKLYVCLKPGQTPRRREISWDHAVFNFGGRKKTHKPWQAFAAARSACEYLGLFWGWQGRNADSHLMFFTKNKGDLKSYSKKEGSFVIAFGQGCCFLNCFVFFEGVCKGTSVRLRTVPRGVLVSIHFIWSVGEKLWKGGGAGALGGFVQQKVTPFVFPYFTTSLTFIAPLFVSSLSLISTSSPTFHFASFIDTFFTSPIYF